MPALRGNKGADRTKAPQQRVIWLPQGAVNRHSGEEKATIARGGGRLCAELFDPDDRCIGARHSRSCPVSLAVCQLDKNENLITGGALAA